MLEGYIDAKVGTMPRKTNACEEASRNLTKRHWFDGVKVYTEVICAIFIAASNRYGASVVRKPRSISKLP